MDKESEFLLFPTIYCGQTRADNKERTIPVSWLGKLFYNILGRSVHKANKQSLLIVK